MYIQSGHRWLPSHFPYWFYVGCLETVSGCTQSRNIWTCRRDIPNPSANFTQNWCYCKLSVLSIQIASFRSVFAIAIDLFILKDQHFLVIRAVLDVNLWWIQCYAEVDLWWHMAPAAPMSYLFTPRIARDMVSKQLYCTDTFLHSKIWIVFFVVAN